MARNYDWSAQRDKMVDAVVADLMSGEAKNEMDNYSPFLPKNFAEFLNSISDDYHTDERDQLLELMVEQSDCVASEQQRVLSLIGLKLVILNRDYWENLARERAEREVPTSHELDLCAQEDAAEAMKERIAA